MVKDEDFDVRPSELIGWLRVEIRDRGRREGTSDSTKLFRPTSHQDGSVSMDERDVEVRVLSTQHRGKKQNRRNIIENGWSHYPITSLQKLTASSPAPIPGARSHFLGWSDRRNRNER